MRLDNREGMVNTCFLLPQDVSADLKKLAIDDETTLQDLLTGLVYDYLYGEE